MEKSDTVTFNDNTKGNIVKFIILFLSILLVPNISVACSTDEDCSNEEYCDTSTTDPFSGGHVCKGCNTPDNASFDTNGERNGTGPTSCPWKCNDTYYKDGNECKLCNDAGKYWDTTSNTCETAGANYFSPAGDINKYQCPYGSVTLDDSSTRQEYSLSFTDPEYHDSIDDCYWYRNKIYDGKNQNTQFIQWKPSATDHKHHIPLSASIKAKGLRDLDLAAE